jgi:O-antigen/teichoic acid export membrane protein
MRSLGQVIRSGSYLSLGSALAHTGTLLALPFIAKFYGPEAFGLAAGWLATVSIAASVACLRYDTAIPLPQDDRAAACVLVAALLSAVATCSAIAVGLGFCFAFKVSEIFNFFGSLAGWLPVGIFVIALVGVFTQWLARVHEIRSLVGLKCWSAGATALFQLSLASAGTASMLVAGDIGGRLTALLASGRLLYRSLRAKLTDLNFRDVWLSFNKYRHHSRWMTPTALLDSLGQQAPLLLMIGWYGDAVGGQFSLAQRVLALPVALLGQSLAQVYFPIMAKTYNSSCHEARSLFLKISGILALFATVLVVAVTLINWEWVSTLLGQNWAGINIFMLPLAAGIAVQLVVSTVSQTAIVCGGQKWYALWVFLWVAMTVLGMSIGHRLASSVGAVWGLVLGSSAMYTVLWCGILFSLNSLGRREQSERVK